MKSVPSPAGGHWAVGPSFIGRSVLLTREATGGTSTFGAALASSSASAAANGGDCGAGGGDDSGVAATASVARRGHRPGGRWV